MQRLGGRAHWLSRRMLVLFGVGLVGLGLVIGWPAIRAQDKSAGCSASPSKQSKEQPESKVPEEPFPGPKPKAPSLDGGLGWLNTAGPIELARLKGKVVLLDFWTYCCINCMHVLPELEQLEREFPNELVVIGVHSAKFLGEQDTENIRGAILRYGVKHPVVNDGEMAIWRRYGVRSWPTLVLIDPEGFVIGGRSGEGNYEVFREAITRLVTYHKAKGTLDPAPLHFQLESYGAETTPLRFPGKVAFDAERKRLAIADSSHNRIVVADTSGQVQHVIGGGTSGLQDGSFDQARFNDPQGMVFSGQTLYVADTKNHALRRVDLAAGTVTTIAGTGRRGYERRGGADPTKVSLASPWDLFLRGRQLYIAMAGDHQIWVMDLDKNTIGVFAGNGRENITDGDWQSAEFAQPSGLASDGRWLYVADSEVSAIRRVGLTESRVETIVGAGLFEFGDSDGTGNEVRLQHALGVAFHDGMLYVADTYNNKLKLIDPRTKESRTIFGDGQPGRTDDPPRFDEPGGLTIAGGVLYVADTNNHRVRVVDLATKRIRTLELVGLSAPAAPAENRALPEATIAEVESVVLKPSGRLTIAGAVDVPADHKLNPKAPMSYRLETLDAAGKSQLAAQGRIEPVAAEFEIAPKVDLTGAKAVRVAVVYYPCETKAEGVCRVKTQIWSVPISLDPRKGTERIELR